MLSNVKLFRVPRSVIEETECALREVGSRGLEVFVLWSGLFNGEVFEVRTAHIPAQSSYQLREGLVVRIDGDALHQLNAWLFKHGEALAVQVHSHPRAAYHSDTDNTYPIVTTLGGLSIVAPDFCAGPLLGRGTAAYRLTAHGWQPISRRRLARMVVVDS